MPIDAPIKANPNRIANPCSNASREWGSIGEAESRKRPQAIAAKSTEAKTLAKLN